MDMQFRLPDVGEGLTEADIVAWHVKPGEAVTINQVIVEIETAKAVVELPSPYAGTVSALLVAEGQTVDVGTPIITVDVPVAAEDGTPPKADAPPQPEDAPSPAQTADQPAGTGDSDAEPPARQPVLVGYGVKPGSTSRRPRKKPPTRPGPYPASPNRTPDYPPGPAAPSAGAPPFGGSLGGRPPRKAPPPVRRLARDLGIDLGGLAGSGPEGSVTRDDVQKAAGEARDRSVSEESAPGAGGQGTADERIPVRGVRKHTAAAMVASAFSAPHVTEFLQVDVSETMAAVSRARELPEFAGVRVSPLLFVAKALLVAVRRNPMINSSWDEAAQEIVVKRAVNLGIAVAAERGLLVPNVKGADALPLAGLARAFDELTATARAGKASPADLSGGTITITNVGVFGVDAGTPILMPGEAAILAFGRVRAAPWVVDGDSLAVRKVTTLSLSFDHRIVDGQLGSAVLRDVGSMLEDPVRMLAWS
jgi:2-oxoisovalerate dehydrogenase E2 component (dihydrolipoyl transacylase)